MSILIGQTAHYSLHWMNDYIDSILEKLKSHFFFVHTKAFKPNVIRKRTRWKSMRIWSTCYRSLVGVSISIVEKLNFWKWIIFSIFIGVANVDYYFMCVRLRSFAYFVWQWQCTVLHHSTCLWEFSCHIIGFFTLFSRYFVNTMCVCFFFRGLKFNAMFGFGGRDTFVVGF